MERNKALVIKLDCIQMNKNTAGISISFTQVECLGVLLADLPAAVEGRLEPAVHGHGLDPRRPRRRGRERRLLEHDLLHPLLGRHGERVAPGRRRLHMEARQQQRRGGAGGVRGAAPRLGLEAANGVGARGAHGARRHAAASSPLPPVPSRERRRAGRRVRGPLAVLPPPPTSRARRRLLHRMAGGHHGWLTRGDGVRARSQSQWRDADGGYMDRKLVARPSYIERDRESRGWAGAGGER